MYPSVDPWGQPLDAGRAARAGTRLAGPWSGAFDGVQADQDFIAAIFELKRSLFKESSSKRFQQGSYRHKQCCFYCDAVAEGPDQSLLYTTWGRSAAYRRERRGSTIDRHGVEHEVKFNVYIWCHDHIMF